MRSLRLLGLVLAPLLVAAGAAIVPARAQIQPQQSWTILASGGAGGTITPDGAVQVAQGDSQSFTIAPEPGFHISDVLVDSVSVGALASYTFDDVSADHTIAASFAVTLRTLSVMVNGGGSVTRDPDLPAYPEGSTVDLTAVPGIGWAFSEWGGDAEGSENPITLTVDDDLDVTVTFVDTMAPAVTVVAPNGGEAFPTGANLTFQWSATDNLGVTSVDLFLSRTGAGGPYEALALGFANSGSHAWTVTGVPTAAAVFRVVARDAAVNTGEDTSDGDFTLGEWIITATAGLGGTITPTGASPDTEEVVMGPVNHPVTPGADLGFTIAPLVGYHILDVMIDGVSVGPVGSYTFNGVSANHTIVATFARTTHTITAVAGPGGAITPSGAVIVNQGDSQTFDIVPDAHYHLLDVTVDGVSVGAVASYTFDGVSVNHTIAAAFELTTHTITATAGANGVISPAGVVVVADGGTQGFTITPDAHYHVLDVTVDGVSVGATASYTFSDVTADHTIAATFELTTHTIAASAGAGGVISPSGAVTVADGDTLSFVITPDAHYHLLDVTVDGVSVGAIAGYTFSDVTADHTIAATFELTTHTITASSGPGGAIVPGGAVVVADGGTQAFSIIPDLHYHVLDVTVDGVSVGALSAYTFSDVTADHTVAATFELTTHTITASAGANGAISPSGAIVVADGGTQAFVITPDLHHQVLDVTVDGVSVGAVSGYTFSDVTTDHTIAATFALTTHTITATAGANGTISPSGAVLVGDGGTQTFVITPDPHHHVLEVTVDGVPVGPTAAYTFTDVTADHTIVATFALTLHTLTASAGPGGVISPNGAISVADGDTLTFSITPDVHFHVLDVVVDGVSVGPTVSHTFSDVGASHTILATFELTTHVVTASAGPGGSISPAGAVVVADGSAQTFDIVPNLHYHVLDVAVDGVPAGALTSHTFTDVTSDHTISASFAVTMHAVATTASGNGSVTRNPELPLYPEGSTVQLTAVADAGYAFTGWSGDASGGANPLLLTVDGDRAVTATFAPLSLEETAATFAPYTAGSLPPAWGDYDGDGDVDLPLYHNNGNGTFSEIPGFRPLLNDGNYHGASWCDYDRDGDVDLVLLPYNGVEGSEAGGIASLPQSANPPVELARVRLLRNQGNGSFVDVAPSLGMDVSGFGETAVWGDFDADGWPDLYTPYYAHLAPNRSFLYHNNGNGTFTDVATTAGVDLAGQPAGLKPEGAQAADYDDDGDLDLYCASHLFVNDGNGMFTDMRAQVGLPLAFDEGSMFVDYDNDGDLDLYLKLATGPALYRNDAGSFTDVSTAAGLTDVGFGWGDSWADVDNDGDLDLYLILPSFQPAHLMLNQGNGTFVRDPTFNVLDSSGLNAWADDDRDGDLDLHVEAYNRHRFENVTDRRPGFAGSFIRVLVVDGSGRRTQHGATVRLRRVDGPPGVIQTRVVDSGSGYLTQSEYVVHFGVVPSGTYALSVSFPSHPGSRVVVDETQVAWLGSIVPATLGGQVVTVYRSGEANPWDWVVAATAGDNGTVRPSGAPPQEPDEIVVGPSNYPASQGSSLTFMITPAPGYHVADVIVDGISVGPVTSYTFDNITANHSIAATYAVTYHSLTVDVAGSGSVTKDPDLASYPELSTVELTAVPDPGFALVAWSGDATGNANPLALVMDADKNVTATFAEAVPPVVTVVAPNGGELLESGASVSLQWTATDNVGVTSVDLLLSRSGPGGPYETLAAAVANSGSYAWTVAGTTTANAVFKVVARDAAGNAGADVSDVAFALGNWVITATTGEGGTIAPSGAVPVDQGADQGFTITASAGYHIDDVVVDGNSVGPVTSYTFTGTAADHTIAASFAVTYHTLSVSVSGTGSVAKSPDLSAYPEGSAVQLTALPGSGFALTAWSGDASGSANPLALLMDTDKVVTAAFADVAGPNVTVVAPNGGESFLTGASVNLLWTATDNVGVTSVDLLLSRTGVAGVYENIALDIPNTGSYAWTVTGAVTTNAILKVRARDAVGNPGEDTSNSVFTLGNWVITATAGSNGTITPSGATAVSPGASQSFTVAPSLGYHVLDVLVDGASVGAVSGYTFTNVTADHTIAASFAINTYTMTVNLAGSGAGSVLKSPDLPTYTWGSTVQLMANPGSGSSFTGWSGDTTGTTNPVTFTMRANKSVTATFADIASPSVTVVAPNGGESFLTGASVNLLWTANDNVGVTSVDLLLSRTGVAGAYENIALGIPNTGSYAWTVTGAVTTNAILKVRARDAVGNLGEDTSNSVFTLGNWVITATAGSNGTITPSGAVVVRPGANQTFTIAPSLGYHVLDVLVDGASVGAPTSYTFTNVTANHTIAASFAINTYTMTVNLAGSGAGSVLKSPDLPTYTWGSTVQLTANPASSSNFTGWSGDTTGTTNPVTFTMRANKSVTASFTLKQWTLAASAGSNGTISPSGAVVVNHGTNQTFTMTPNTGYHVLDVLVDGASVGALTSYTFTNVTANHTIVASFEINTYTMTVNLAGSGAGSVGKNPDLPTYTWGSTVQLNANAGSSSDFTAWSGDTTGTANPVTFTMRANKSVTATFTLKKLTLTASAGSNGTISPSGAVIVNYGTNQTFTMTPSTGYHVQDVLVDGASVGAGTSYTFTNVTANHTIAVSFAINTYTLSLNATAGGSATKSPDQALYDHGTVVTLTATPAPGNAFWKWTGAVLGTNPVTTVTMTSNRSVTANFVVATLPFTQAFTSFPTGPVSAYQIGGAATDAKFDTFAVAGSSTVSITTGRLVLTRISNSTSFTRLTDIANPAPGLLVYAFNLQKASGTGTTAPCANLRVGSGFGPGATDEVSDANTYAKLGLVLTTDSFRYLLRGPTSADTATAANNAAITWVLNRTGGTLSYLGPGGATVAIGNDSTHAWVNTALRLRLAAATPSVPMTDLKYSHFTNNNSAFAFDNFNLSSPGRYTLNVMTAGPGSVSTSPSTAVYAEGSVATLTATPAVGYQLSAWSGDATGSANPQSVTMNANKSVTATFTIRTFPIVATAGANGSIAPGGTVVVNYGGSQSYTITPDLHYHILDVKVDGVSVGAVGSYTFTNVTAAHTIDATFELTTHTITASAGANGAISPSGAVTVADGAEQAFTITPGAGYHVADVVVDGASVGPVGNYTFTDVTADHTIVASFAVTYHTLAVTIDGSGSVTKAPDLAEYPEGSTVQLTALPDAGFAFIAWSGDTSGSANPLTLTMDTDKTVTATFGAANIFQTSGTTFPAYSAGALPPAWADYDNDGDPDLPLYRNDGNGTFSEMPGIRALLNNGNYHGSSWCDYDRDGNADLALQPFTGSGTDRALLLHNQGDGSFTNVAPAQGMDVSGYGATAVWGDFDNDGWPDLFRPFYSYAAPSRSFLYHNNGNGTFTDVAAAAGVELAGLPPGVNPEGAQAADYDDDGDLDLYCAGHLFRNDGTGSFTDVRAASGLPMVSDGAAMFEDYDNDGDLDLYLRVAAGPRLFQNVAGQFTEVSAAAGLPAVGFNWGDSWADVDHDGDVDLYQVQANQPARVMLNQGDGTFAQDPTFNILDSSGLTAWADDDGDGDLDLHVEANQRHRLANTMAGRPGFAGSFLKVRVLDAGGRYTEQGATVRLRRVDGPAGVIQTRVVDGGSGYLTQSEYTVHFGVAPVGTYALEVSFPSPPGARVIVDSIQVAWLGNVAPATLGGQTITVFRDGRAHLGDWTITATAGTGGAIAPSGAVAVSPGANKSFTITPDAGYHVLDVLVDGVSVGALPGYMFSNVTADHTIAASFAITYHTLAVNVVGSGSVTKDPDLAQYAEGSTVQLTAVPGSGFGLTAWSGGVSGSANPVNLLMDADQTVTATFADIAAPSVTVVAPNGGGSYVSGASVDLQWTASDNVSVTSVDLLLSRTGTGGTYETLASGIANSGSYAWTVSGAVTTNGVFKVVARDAAGNAGQDTGDGPSTLGNWVITATAGAGGSITPAGAVAVSPGADQSFTITASAGHHVLDVLVDGASVGALPGYTFGGVSANHTIAASFAITYHTLAVNVVGGGSVTKDPDLAQYAEGSSVQLTAVPGSGFAFTAWSGDLSGVANPVDLLMDADHAVTATFADVAAPSVTVIVPNGGEDYLTGANVNVQWSAMDNASVTAVDVLLSRTGAAGSYETLASGIANSGSYGWTVSGVVTASAVFRVVARDAAGNTGQDTGDGPCTLGNWTITATAGTGGAIAPSGAVAVSPGANKSFAITPDAGYHVLDVLVDGVSVGALPGYMFSNVTADHTIAASFAITYHTLAVNVVGSGSVTKDPDLAQYAEGSTVQLTAVPGSGFGLTAWSGGVSGSANPVNLLMDADQTVTATFADIAAPSVTVVAPNGGGSYVSGASVDLQWTASDNVSVTSVDLLLSRTGTGGTYETLASGIANSGSYAWTVSGAVTTNGVFKVVARDAAGNAGQDTGDGPSTLGNWVITATAGAGGSITPAGAVAVSPGADQSFTITAVVGYHITDVLVDGVSVGALPGYTFTNMTADHTIAASFAVTSFMLAVETVGGGSVMRDPAWASYPTGSTVELTAVPGTGFAFVAWGGDASGNANPLDLLMDADKSVTAVFADVMTPNVTVVAPDGGESYTTGASANLQWTASDNAAVTTVDLLLSRMGPGGPFDSLAVGVANTGSYDWTVTDPATTSAVLKVVAHDAAGNAGEDESDAAFMISGTTGVEALATPVPGTLTLGPVQPNPMRDLARIAFGLPVATRVRLQILDLQGREVVALAGDVLAAGSYVMAWDGRREGRRMPTGMYFVRLQAGGRHLVRRLVLAH